VNRPNGKTTFDRLESYFVAHDVKDDGKKRAILLSESGAATYKLIRSLVAPQKPIEVDYKDLLAKAKAHFAPTPSTIVQCYKFNTRVRQQGESVAGYIAELRALSTHCDYSEMLEDLLRDRFVCGIADNNLQHRLLAESKLTFARGVEIAQATETTEKDSKSMVSQTPGKVLFTSVPCYRCGGTHPAGSCPFKEATCHKCSKKGHIAKACKSHKKTKFPTQKSSTSKSQNKSFKPMNQINLIMRWKLKVKET